MFINALKKAISTFKTEQHTSFLHPGLCELLERAKESQSNFVRKPVEWRRTERAVASTWEARKGVQRLEEALVTADAEQKTKWALQIVEAASVLNCECEKLLYEVRVFIDGEDNVQLDVSSCHNPVAFHESSDPKSNRMVFWLAITPNLPRQGGWRTNFCLQQWLGEVVYRIFEGEWAPYHGSVLSWFLSAQRGVKEGTPVYKRPEHLPAKAAAVVEKMLDLSGGRYATFEMAQSSLRGAFLDS